MAPVLVRMVLKLPSICFDKSLTLAGWAALGWLGKPNTVAARVETITGRNLMMAIGS